MLGSDPIQAQSITAVGQAVSPSDHGSKRPQASPARDQKHDEKLVFHRIYRCHACELRVRTFARPERAGADHPPPGSARALERRDRLARRRRKRRLVLTAIAAAAIGAAVAKWFVLD